MIIIERRCYAAPPLEAAAAFFKDDEDDAISPLMGDGDDYTNVELTTTAHIALITDAAID